MTDRPSDEVTGKVVARWKGEGVYLRYSQAPVKQQTKLLSGHTLTVFDNTGRTTPCDDPRVSTDAALELLRHLECTGPNLRIDEVHEDSTFYKWDEGSISIPVSGAGLCYAVIRLAARVWGVEG